MISRVNSLRLLTISLLCLMTAQVHAGRISDIRNTKHNFSSTVVPSDVTRTASASRESQICAFCHTPHGGNSAPKVPIWNRKLSGATYIPYSSGSLDATDLGQPGGKSKLCLSCHDGTIALGSVNVLNRVQNAQIPFSGTSDSPPGTIPEGLGALTGFTRRLGVDLSNDHPISFTFDDSQAQRDGELYHPSQVTHLQERNQQKNPGQFAYPQGHFLPLEDNKVECITCHDPHIRSDVPGENIKFLRVNRFQKNAEPIEGNFNADNDIICIACHNKAGWVGSAHANKAVGNERYADAAAALREFPKNTEVWQAACLNCHDPHTVQGSRRILREGTDGPVRTDPVSGGRYKQGGKPAVEEVCYACHANPALPGGAQTLQGQINPSNNTSFEVPDIKTDFTTMARHMPIASADQPAGMEVHDIGTGNSQQGDRRGEDFIESPENLGKGNLVNRHAECTDCHNPHRVMKNRQFNDDNSVPDAAGTHPATAAALAGKGRSYPSNIASGVLRGIWGVEPQYGSTAFGSEPVSFEVKRGDPAPITGVPEPSTSEPYLTREYQLCFKCHSNYTYNQPPMLGSFSGGTPPSTNSMTRYTNQAMEYQSPSDHAGDVSANPATPSGAYVGGGSCTVSGLVGVTGYFDSQGNCVNFQDGNHRAWHPVVKATGRTSSERGGTDPNDWREPFNTSAGLGVQTMYCTDCHGSSTDPETIVPKNGENGYVWGPHGSDNNFLLKGTWSDQTGENTPPTSAANALCFKCHDFRQYGRDVPPANWNSPSQPVQKSGFSMATGAGTGCLPFKLTNLHVGHASFVTNFRCTYCHVAVPHGWKNKVFLANLNDVGLEAPLLPGELTGGTAQSRQVRLNKPDRYYNGPYYNGAALKVRSFARSGQWVPENCGSSGAPGNGLNGVNWMNGSTETCANLP
ncbi:MAG: hypothetical protein GC138_03005 [Gammaproteobacteria bacterium]|nr:hypothetical protein [Gammaproteobacteria bacterium]